MEDCNIVTKTIELDGGEGAFQMHCETHGYAWQPGETIAAGTLCPIGASQKTYETETAAKVAQWQQDLAEQAAERTEAEARAKAHGKRDGSQ